MENQLRRDGKLLVCGIDEVGRGSIAGPMVAAAVVLPAGCRMRLRDSKLLTKPARLKLDGQIRKKALSIGLGWVSNTEIDEIGVTAAITLMYERALSDMAMDVSFIVIDGNYDYLSEYEIAQTLVRADQKVACVAAASIVAKVARDGYMRAIAKDFPEYGFESHVGYGTKAHRDNLRTHGLSDLHRRSYCHSLA